MCHPSWSCSTVCSHLPQKSPAKQTRTRSPLSQHGPAKRGSSSPSSLKATLNKQSDVAPAPSPGMELDGYLSRCGISSDIKVTYASSETDLIEKLVQLVKRYVRVHCKNGMIVSLVKGCLSCTQVEE